MIMKSLMQLSIFYTLIHPTVNNVGSVWWTYAEHFNIFGFELTGFVLNKDLEVLHLDCKSDLEV